MSEDLSHKIDVLKKLKLLFVEDEVDLLDIISETLEKLDVNFLTASNGQEGLDVLKENPDIDVVITDVSMPVMNGLEMIRDIRALYPDMTVIVMSAHTETHYIEESQKFGVKNYLLKPFDFIKFIDLVTDEENK